MKRSLPRWVAVWLMPAAVFQSVIVGGAYGTGREVAEYIARFGPWGGVGVIALAGAGFGAILAVSFEFARITRCFDYRRFLRALLGRAWFLYELMFVLLLLVVLAVTGAAAGSILADAFDVGRTDGVLLMLGVVVITTYFGRRIVSLTLTAGAVLLTLMILGVMIIVLLRSGGAIAETFTHAETVPGWVRSACVFVLYNSALTPVLLYVAAPLTRRREAIGAGLAAGLAGVLPAFAFHVAFMSAYPEIVAAELPTYRIIDALGMPALRVLYVSILFMTIVQTGVGVLQGVNDRLENWWREEHARGLAPWQRSLVAAGAVLASLWLAEQGIVALVARGYGTLAWGFLFVYTLPVMTIGVARILRSSRQPAAAAHVAQRETAAPSPEELT